jgi:hypothetical protein
MADDYTPSAPEAADFNFNIEGYTPEPPLAANFEFSVALYFALAGSSNIFTAIWADPDAGLTSGKFYALSWGQGAALSILNSENKVLYDYYTQTYGGRAEETLIDTDTKDLNV